MTNDFTIESTNKTPYFHFSSSCSSCVLIDVSIPEDSDKFFLPILRFMAEHLPFAKQLTFNFVLAYFNTHASKSLLDICKQLELAHKKGSKITINWFWSEDDEDMLEAGEDMQQFMNCPFQLIEFSETGQILDNAAYTDYTSFVQLLLSNPEALPLEAQINFTTTCVQAMHASTQYDFKLLLLHFLETHRGADTELNRQISAAYHHVGLLAKAIDYGVR